VAFLMKAPKKY